MDQCTLCMNRIIVSVEESMCFYERTGFLLEESVAFVWYNGLFIAKYTENH